MKRNRKLAVVICICLILSLCLPFFLSGCRKKKIDSEMSVYYLNEDRTGLVKAPYETGGDEKEQETCGRNMHLSYFVLVSAVFPFRLPEEENRFGDVSLLS